jgi:Domain of unknown function (DUF6458)
MGIGVSIFLIALGAILTFATNIRVSGIDLDMVGIILMIAGVIGLVMFLVVWGPRRRRVSGPVVEQERRVYDDRPPMP